MAYLTLIRKLKRIINTFEGLILPNKAKKYWASLPISSAKTGYATNLYSLTNQFLYNHFIENFDSVLEIGSNCGNRLIEAAEKFPNKTFVGIDINSDAVKLGSEIIDRMKLKNIELIALDLNNITQLELENLGKYDIVFTWASLIYVHPFYIKQILRNIFILANKQVLILERINPRNSISHVIWDYIWNSPNWAHNFSHLIRQIKSDAKITFYNIPIEIWHPGGGNGAILNIELNNA